MGNQLTRTVLHENEFVLCLIAFGAAFGLPNMGLVLVSLLLAEAVLLGFYLSKASKIAPVQREITDVDWDKSDAIPWIIPYFIAWGTTQIGSGAYTLSLESGIYATMLLIWAWARREHSVNPLVIFVGYRVAFVSTPGGAKYYLLYRGHDVAENSRIYTVTLSQILLLSVKR